MEDTLSPDLPWYQEIDGERALFEQAYRQRLPLMLMGPTGCGKSRFVEHMAARLGRPLVTVAAHEETSAVDLLGRHLIQGGETVWQDGPVTRAVRQGAVLYIDEVVEARSDVVVVLHPLTDHRRQLFLDRLDERLDAPEEFMLVVSFNPGYQRGFKQLKPSTRQRFVGLHFGYPEASVEAQVLQGEAEVDARTAKALVALATKLRELPEQGLAEPPSTRLLVNAARLMRAGVHPRRACRAAILAPMTDDTELLAGLGDVVDMVF
ncbi:MAG: CbbQ/NirQ/NorQ/GpvN family protein [Alphaproteobacteria bacterium]|nr:CbbQ/NirQ/NorQ/GpvN family protein [Alphaproteobacteria bacterium]